MFLRGHMATSVAALCAAESALTSPVFSVDFTATDSLPAEITHSRAGHATYFDSTGKLTYAPNNLLLYSNDLTQADWTNNTYTITPGQSDPFGGNNAIRLKANSASDFIYQFAPTDIGSTFINSVWVKRVLGTGNVTIRNAANASTVISINGDWQRFSVVGTTTGLTMGAQIILANSLDQIDVYGFQCEKVTYQTSPRDYKETTSALYYGPRVDYDPVGLTRKGLLVEDAATNLLFPSIPASTNDTWPAASGTITLANATGPDGLPGFARFLETAGGAGHGAYQQALPVLVSAGSTYRYSTYVKGGLGRTKLRLTFGDGAITNGGYAEFDISTGVVLTDATAFGTGAVTAGSAMIQPVGGGIYRLSLAGALAGTQAYLVVNSLNDAGAYSFSGDVSKGFYWGYSQVEAGSGAPTSYIPTTGASVTRAAETLSANSPLSEHLLSASSTWRLKSLSTGADSADTYEAGAWSFVRGYYYKKIVVGGEAVPVYLSDFTTSDSLPAGMTHSRAGHAMYYDSTGKLTYAPNNLYLYTDFSQRASGSGSDPTLWYYGSNTIGSTVTDPLGGSTGRTINFANDAFSGGTLHHYVTNLVVGAQYIISFYVKEGASSPASNIRLIGVDSAGWAGSFSVKNALTGSWQRISYKFTANDTWMVLGLDNRDNTGAVDTDCVGNVDVALPQLERVTYQTSPRAYVATTSAAYYGHRVDYDPNTLTRKGLLTEYESTNLVTYSGDLSNAVWTLRNASRSTGSTDALDGVGKMTSVNFTAADGAIYQQYPTAVTAGQRFTISFWAKAGTASQLYAGTNGLTQAANNLAGSLITVTSTPARYSVTITVATNDTGLYFMIGGAIPGGGLSLLPSTGTIEIWGVQAERYSIATSYIPTTTAPVTRANDFYRLDLAGLTASYTQLVKATFTGGAEMLNGVTGANADSSEVYMVTGDVVGYAYKAAGGTNILTYAPAPDLVNGDLFTAVNSYGSNIFKFAVNGNYQEMALSGPVRVPEKFHIGNYNGGTSYHAASHVKKIAIYDQTLSQAQITSLSSQ